MNKTELDKYIGSRELTLVEAMQKIDLNSKGILYIVDEQGHLIGSLTDGDIRRWIIKTGKLDGVVSQMLFGHTRFLFEGDQVDYEDYMTGESITSVPIVNTDKIIVDIVFDNSRKQIYSKSEHALQKTPVIIMAGGRGVRLHPYTKILPKPLIPIGDIPIIERIMDRFYMYGADEFYLTVNYKKDMIKAYFAEKNLPYKISYVEEDMPLGTAGSIKLIDKRFERPVFVTNCDILVEADYGNVLKCHRESANAMTIISSLKHTTIPYGVIHSREHGIVTSMEEKPRFSYFINTGMYVVEPGHFKKIPKGVVYHMTDLADKLMEEGQTVGMYPVSENSFLDMGEFEEMKKMEERITNGDKK